MSRRIKYPSRTVAAARALYRLGMGPTRIAEHLCVNKEAVSAWVNQGWRAGVEMDAEMLDEILAIIARGVVDPKDVPDLPEPEKRPTPPPKPRAPAESPRPPPANRRVIRFGTRY